MIRLANKAFEAHSDEIFVYLCRYCKDRALAEDMLGDVFVRLVEELGKREDFSKTADLRPWLYRVATNLAISHFRRQKVRDFFARSKGKREVCAGESAGALEARSAAFRVKSIVGELSEKLKSVIILSAFQELSYEEISAVLNINVGTVKSRLSEARRIIRDKLGGLGEI